MMMVVVVVVVYYTLQVGMVRLRGKVTTDSIDNRQLDSEVERRKGDGEESGDNSSNQEGTYSVNSQREFSH